MVSEVAAHVVEGRASRWLRPTTREASGREVWNSRRSRRLLPAK